MTNSHSLSSILLNIFKNISFSDLKETSFRSIKDDPNKRDSIRRIVDQDEMAMELIAYFERFPRSLTQLLECIEENNPLIASEVTRQIRTLDPKRNQSHESSMGSYNNNYSLRKADRSGSLEQLQSHVDVLIITAAPGEQEALFECVDFPTESPQHAKNSWQRKSCLDSNLEYYQKQFTYKDSGKITIASVNTLDYGETHAAIIASKFTTSLKPNCLAIVGICAGYRKENIRLGDIIVAEKLFRFIPGEHSPDITTYKLKPDWYQQIKNYEGEINHVNWEYLNVGLPKSYEYQSHWLLHTLFEHKEHQGVSPENHPDREKKCPEFIKVVDFLEEDGLLKWNSDADLVLTEKALTKVKIEKKKNILLVEPELPRIWFRPVATGSQRLEDDGAFERIRQERSQRYTCGYDMEGYSIAESAWYDNLDRMIFVKAVSDYGDSQRERNGHFRHYACKASATFLIHFLKEHYLD